MDIDRLITVNWSELGWMMLVQIPSLVIALWMAWAMGREFCIKTIIAAKRSLAGHWFSQVPLVLYNGLVLVVLGVAAAAILGALAGHKIGRFALELPQFWGVGLMFAAMMIAAEIYLTSNTK